MLTMQLDSLTGQSFEQMVERQPAKKGRMGTRSFIQLTLAACIGAVEQSVPALRLSTIGLFPQLSNYGDEYFSKGANLLLASLDMAGLRLGNGFWSRQLAAPPVVAVESIAGHC